MKVEITQEQAQHLVNVWSAAQEAQRKLDAALQTLAPGIGDAILREVEGKWHLTDEPESEAEDG